VLAYVPFWNGEAKQIFELFASDQHALVGLPQPLHPAKQAPAYQKDDRVEVMDLFLQRWMTYLQLFL
jgi:hypothetical protein